MFKLEFGIEHRGCVVEWLRGMGDVRYHRTSEVSWAELLR